MVYRFELLPPALRQLEKLDTATRQIILRKLEWLAMRSDPLKFCRRLQRSKIGDVRFRIGNYRAIAIIRENTIGILKIAHRREVYRDG